jgi:tRNA(Ile)-lysidine synthase
LHLPCFVAKIDVQQHKQRGKTSWEEAARRVRYRFYEQTAQTHGFSKIALGHHSGDTAELVLMNLLRGSGPQGLCGIPPVRDGRIVRPFIQVTKPEILNFLAAENIDYLHDASNDDLQYLRNRIRHQLLPLLKADYNPNVCAALNRTACVLREEEAWLEGITASLLRRAELDASPGSLRLSIERLRAIPAGGLRRTIRRALLTVKGDLRRISFAHIEAVVRLIDVDRQGASVDLPERIRVERAGPALEIFRTTAPLRQLAPTAKRCPPPSAFAYRVSPPGVFHVPELGMRMTLTRCGIEALPEPRCAGQQTAFFDMDRLVFPLLLRNHLPGDRFTPLGMRGHQTVAVFLKKQKIPRHRRLRCPVLVSGNSIIWVAGHRIDDDFKVRPATTRLLIAEVSLA